MRPMKVLYISPENTVDSLSLWKKAHEDRGNQCTFITMYRAKSDYDPGICLDLPLIAANKFYIKSRHKYYQLHRGPEGSYSEKEGYPPIWEPNSKIEDWYFQFRDWLWHFNVEKAINDLDLMHYDIYHFEWGLDFYRDGRFARKLSKNNKPIVCTYHGQDLRTRGVIRAVDNVSQLNLTSELDLLDKHPDIQYLFLPFDTGAIIPNYKSHGPIKICHSPTNRYFKGSDTIISICERLAAEESGVEFILIEDLPHNQALEIKQTCDILVDQVHNRGGWGYGMNSVEALAMGLVCVTEFNQEYNDFLPDHPFVHATGASLYSTLKNLINDREKMRLLKQISRAWVEKYHDLHRSCDKLYGYYAERGWV